MQKRRAFETQLIRLSLVASISLLLLSLSLMVYAGISIWLILLTALLFGIAIIHTTHRIYQKLLFQFRSLNNLLGAMMQGDYSLRARSPQTDSEFDKLVTSINDLAEHLSLQRSESVESQILLHTVIDHIDVAIVALTEDNRISFLNPAAKKLLLPDRADFDSNLLSQLSFAQNFSSGHHQVIELSLGGQQGRFNVHVEEFRESSLQRKLLFITDVGTLLRSEERKAWQSLVRVISHEINNSLSPIASISQTLSRLINRDNGISEKKQDLTEGLTIITERANSLRQFVESYKQLAKLPEPSKQSVSISDLLQKICALFPTQKIHIQHKSDVRLLIDPVQFEQVLINLIKNSIESMSQTKIDGVIEVEWKAKIPFFSLKIADEGGGISNLENLFVPFYSTKKHGSGIGLVLCRQIVEAHGGQLSIANRTDTPGCCATIEIPLDGGESTSI